MEKEYLDSIRNGLKILSKEEVDKTISEIEKQINERLAKEEIADILKSMPTAQEQINECLKKHGIDPKMVTKNSNFIISKFEELFKVIQNMVEIMSKNNFKSNLKIVVDLLILFALVSLLKIPFILIRYLGESLLQYLKLPMIIDIWSIIIEIIYIICGIMFFMNVYTKWFKNLKVGEVKEKKEEKIEQPKQLGEDLTSISLSDKKDK